MTDEERKLLEQLHDDLARLASRVMDLENLVDGYASQLDRQDRRLEALERDTNSLDQALHRRRHA